MNWMFTGQNGFRLASYEAILGRLSIHQGRVLLTSRPYTLGYRVMRKMRFRSSKKPVTIRRSTFPDTGEIMPPPGRCFDRAPSVE